MLKKIMAIAKITSLLWISLILPLIIGINYIKSSSKSDVIKCTDNFIHTEGINLSKYIGSQFENTKTDIYRFISEIQLSDLNDQKSVTKALKSLIARNKNVVSITMYNENGRFLASSSEEDTSNLVEENKVQNREDSIKYEIEQKEDNSIVIKYLTLQKVMAEGKAINFYFEIIEKWAQYEKYMNELEEGSFPRMFYIISQNCRRYVSLNSLPPEAHSAKHVAALGMHLVEKINEIPEGLSDINIESLNFRVFKNEINLPEKMTGSKFYIVLAIDDLASTVISNSIFNKIPTLITIMSIICLLICLIISKFYNHAVDQLEIANIISDSTPSATVMFRASDGKIARINMSAIISLRIAKEEAENTNMWNLFIYEDDKNYILSAISSNIQVLNYEVLLQSFGGASFWAICSACPIDINEEKHIVLAVLDINSRKEIEKKLANNAELLEKQIAERTADLDAKAKELEESNSLLEKAKAIADNANNAKSKFLTNASNELKTPINAIIGYSEILYEEALDRKDTVSADDLSKITSSAKHLLSLVEEILDLSKIEAGKTMLFFENINIRSLVKDVESITMPLITNNNNSLFVEYAKDVESMYTDATKLRQCLLNLLSNAAKFTEFGKVTLRVSSFVKEGVDFIEFAVIDTGLGIAPEKIDKIFDPFQENNDSRNSGMGLGLSITKKYAELLGGFVSAESELGIGSKFIFRIPKICTTEANEFIEIKNQNDSFDNQV
ncbi:MAG: PAS domain-containing sensor histidine kinase [Holosporaceae bacterium]|jgi:PAS domain S-box-containing protein|nr:PAS domain-containing sensor histidine kinase [Holosporaceae bacterium]